MCHVPVRCRLDPQEEFMRNLKLATGVAVLCSVLMAGATAAMADTPTAASCLDMADQVKTALASNSQSPNYQEAVKEKNNGQSFCNESFYQYGINHFSHALQLLGANKN
jgi:hypothetical protein